jgi:thiol:disulfide interchange protein
VTCGGVWGGIDCCGLTSMWDWIVTVLTSEFFWGVVVGLVLAAIGAWLQAIFSAKQQQKAQKDLIRNFCINTVDNIKAIVNDMADHDRKLTPSILII